jgi:hypothetical protein
LLKNCERDLFDAVTNRRQKGFAEGRNSLKRKISQEKTSKTKDSTKTTESTL